MQLDCNETTFQPEKSIRGRSQLRLQFRWVGGQANATFTNFRLAGGQQMQTFAKN